MTGCAAAVLAALMASPEPMTMASHDEDACLQMGYIVCTVAETCFEGYDGDRCFQQMQLQGQCNVGDGTSRFGGNGSEDGRAEG